MSIQAEACEMRKVYRHGFEGQDPGSWSRLWRERGARRRQVFELLVYDSLLPLLLAEVARGDRILEGGCGAGHYVFHLWKAGYDVVGVDFDRETVRAVLAEFAGIPIVEGDVTRLQFADGTFDAYYSGGVMEHLEDGPGRALREAWRVLKPGGKLLFVVPHMNLYRRCVDLARRLGARGRLHRSENASGPHRYAICDAPFVDSARADGDAFFQYVCDPPYVKRELERHGFALDAWRPTQVLYGMTELRTARVRFAAPVEVRTPSRLEALSDDALHWLVRTGVRRVPERVGAEALHRERCARWYGRALVGLLRPVFGNLAFYVARKVAGRAHA